VRVLLARDSERSDERDDWRYIFRVRWALAISLVLFAGCTSNVGPSGPVIGGPCVDDFDCAAGSFCLFTFRNGTCTINCTLAEHCRSGSTCVEEGSGVCLLTCETDEDCGRGGYSCVERARRDAAERVTVCVDE
jgi:hypothetical protein